MNQRGLILRLSMVAALAGAIGWVVGRVKGQRFTNALTLKHWLENGKTVALIDVRSAEEFAGPLGHIAGAVNIPLAQLLARVSAPAAFGGQPIITI